MRRFRVAFAAAVTIACAVVVAACGSSSNKSSSGSSSSSAPGGLSLAGLANTKPEANPHMGGTLNVITAEAWEHLDPQASYFQIDYIVEYSIQTPLYMFTPTSPTKPVPLLAAGPAIASPDGKTVTVHIKPNWKFGPPVNRTITSTDVEFAFE